MNKLGLLYFGRLDEEKWFDAILEMVYKFAKKHDWEIHISSKKKFLPFQLFIFGDWKYRKEVLDLVENFDDIHYFGFKPLSEIIKVVPNCNYVLMPSRFLETFGLSALNAISWWLPVIWTKSGWMEDFILDELSITTWKNLSQLLFERVESLLEDNSLWPEYRKKLLSVSNKFHLADWEKRIKCLFPSSTKNILLVSDFKTKIGWIETYVCDAKKNLEKMWYEVESFWIKIPSWFWWKLCVKVWVFVAIFNFVSAIKLYKKRHNNYDLVWFNWWLRMLWWLGYWVVARFFYVKEDIKIKKSFFSKIFSRSVKSKQIWMFFHDFGYFTALPSKTHNLNEIPIPFNLKNFILSAKTKNPFIIIALFWKFFSLILIRKISKKYVDKFLVPSSFMKKIVVESYEISEYKIYVLNHFVQE